MQHGETEALIAVVGDCSTAKRRRADLNLTVVGEAKAAVAGTSNGRTKVRALA